MPERDRSDQGDAGGQTVEPVDEVDAVDHPDDPDERHGDAHGRQSARQLDGSVGGERNVDDGDLDPEDHREGREGQLAQKLVAGAQLVDVVEQSDRHGQEAAREEPGHLQRADAVVIDEMHRRVEAEHEQRDADEPERDGDAAAAGHRPLVHAPGLGPVHHAVEPGEAPDHGCHEQGDEHRQQEPHDESRECPHRVVREAHPRDPSGQSMADRYPRPPASSRESRIRIFLAASRACRDASQGPGCEA